MRVIYFLLLVLGPWSLVHGPAFAASAKTTLVVQSWQGNAENEASAKTADILRQKLQEIPFLYVVDPQKTEAVLSYHSGYKVTADPALTAEAEEWLNRAKQHYFDFAFREAQAELKPVLELFAANPGLLLDAGVLLIDAYVTKALVDSALKQKENVEDDFQKILAVNPLFELDAANFTPSFRKIFNTVRENFLQNADSRLVVKSFPKAVEVYLNGVYQGVTPLTLAPLPAGAYPIRFVANHYATHDKNIVLKPGETLSLNPKMIWAGARSKKIENRNQIREGLRIAEILKTDKVLLVDVDQKSITSRLVDRRYRAGHIPLSFPLDADSPSFEKNLDKMARLIAAQTQIDLTKNPRAHLDPDGMGDPILLAKRRRKISKGFLYGGLGAVGIGGLVAGILAASGGGSSTPQTGSVSLNFK
ncbi:MAG: PEGA domain-containing protein [Deltaproteobacteria bacterium]|nr:PEGA domain-containing protein [Deltaproteobacteria bacterium]